MHDVPTTRNFEFINATSLGTFMSRGMAISTAPCEAVNSGWATLLGAVACIDIELIKSYRSAQWCNCRAMVASFFGALLHVYSPVLICNDFFANIITYQSSVQKCIEKFHMTEYHIIDGQDLFQQLVIQFRDRLCSPELVNDFTRFSV